MSFLENKIPPPLVMALFMLAAWLFDSSATDVLWLQIASAVIAIVAVLIARSSVTSFIKARTTVNPLKPESASSLVTSGIFGFTRNPMYLAMALLLLAFGLFFTGWWGFAFTGAYAAFLTQFQIKPEERALIKVFGQEFEDYKQRVRRWC